MPAGGWPVCGQFPFNLPSSHDYARTETLLGWGGGGGKAPESLSLLVAETAAAGTAVLLNTASWEASLAKPGADTCSFARQGRCNSDPNSRSVTILITDSCPECEADHLDIQVRFYRRAALDVGVLTLVALSSGH